MGADATHDAHTGFIVRADKCTGCGMCVLACSSIKQHVFSFGLSHSFIEILPAEEAAQFSVRFTGDCDGCTYCLSFCGFDAIEEPEGWVRPPELEGIRRKYAGERRERRSGSPT